MKLNNKQNMPCHLLPIKNGDKTEKKNNGNSVIPTFTEETKTLPLTKDYLKNYLGKGLKIVSEASKKITKENIQAKANEAKLIKFFLNSGCSIKSIQKEKELIKRLALLDIDNVMQKYECYTKELFPEKRYFDNNPLNAIGKILEMENLTKGGLISLYEMQKESEREYDIADEINMWIYEINEYENFDINPASKQKHCIESLKYYCNLNFDYLNKISDYDDLFELTMFRDLKRCGSKEKLEEELIERMKNKPISPIEVDSSITTSFISDEDFNLDNLENTIGKVDLSKYEKGIPLKYSRKYFIQDFNKELKGLSETEKKQVFDYYKFSIDKDNDIIKFPVPNNSDIDGMTENAKKAVMNTKQLVNDFVLNNKIQLAQEDKEAEEILNKIIKIFPEFISVIGKIQHRGDSIDHHTLEVLQLALKNPKIKNLSDADKRVLFLSIMFHDIAKKENMIDSEHQKPSAYYAKELIKKLPISFNEKERIYNLIKYSHWTTDGSSTKDLACTFRHQNDFEVAKILAEADTESAGFEYSIQEDKIEEIEINIKLIKQNGIPLFADNLPSDTSKFPVDEDGIKYLDFTDKEADLTEYGFPSGTKVKMLNFLCHSSTTSLNELNQICDDSKEICLSTSFLNSKNNLSTGYNSGCNVILSSSNGDIALAGNKVGCTGGQRGFEDFKKYVYMEATENQDKKTIERERKEISEFVKFELDLSDEEYYEFYSQIEQCNDKNDIQDIRLSSGRIIDAKSIKSTISSLHDYLLNNKDCGYYLNEVVIFQPKIQAVIMNKENFFAKSSKYDEIKKQAKENNIPVILV